MFPCNPRESENIYLKLYGDKVVNNASTSSDDDTMSTIFISAKILREVLRNKCNYEWTFQATLKDTDDRVPPELFSFLRWLLIGPSTYIEEETCEEIMHSKILAIADIILGSFMSKRQVGYKSKSTRRFVAPFRSQREWPLQPRVGISVHQSTCSRHSSDLLQSFGLSVDNCRTPMQPIII